MTASAKPEDNVVALHQESPRPPLAKTLDVDAGADLRPLDDGHRLRAIERKALKAQGGWMPDAAPVTTGPVFSAEHFGLDRVPLFAAASDDEKRAVLTAAGKDRLDEAVIIEKLGMAFSAKMLLLSNDATARSVYALFGADEARHLALLSAHHHDPANVEPNVFHRLLSDLIDDGDRASLAFVIQVVLEGWGLSHYRGMRDDTTSDTLRAVFDRILDDEVRHHASGKVVHEELGLSGRSLDYTVEVMAGFCDLVRLGPVSVVDAVDAGLGGISRAQRLDCYRALEGEVHAAARLALLRKLMGEGDVVRALDERGLFSPAPLEACP